MDPIFVLLILVQLFTSTSTLSQHYTCPSNEDCVQDCTTTSCVNYVIQTANAASLHVTCSNGYCSGIQISCPYDTTATCSVECTDSNACKGAVINYPQPQNVELKCSGSSACAQLQLLGPETFSDTTVISSATIQCLGTYACSGASFDLNYVYNIDVSCEYISSTSHHVRAPKYMRSMHQMLLFIVIDGASVTNQITLDCTGKSACGASVHVEQANHFTLNCSSSTHSFVLNCNAFFAITSPYVQLEVCPWYGVCTSNDDVMCSPSFENTVGIGTGQYTIHYSNPSIFKTRIGYNQR
eukprot:125914_1